MRGVTLVTQRSVLKETQSLEVVGLNFFAVPAANQLWSQKIKSPLY